jgi:hypothetical protein
LFISRQLQKLCRLSPWVVGVKFIGCKLHEWRIHGVAPCRIFQPETGKRASFMGGTMFAQINKLKTTKRINSIKNMKTNMLKYRMAVWAAVLVATAVFRASADQAATAVQPDKCYTGTVSAIDPQEHTMTVKEWALSKRAFNLGDNCTYALLDQVNGTVNDLRPGEKITVNYQDSHGVLIADRVEQRPMRFEGMVTAMDADKHTLTLHRPGPDRQLRIADDCKVVLRNDSPGTFADIHAGNHVTVTYETPGGTPTAREIAQTSIEFTGKLTAIDLGEKTVKARALFSSKKFNLADNCAIVINGKTAGQLSDLKPNDRLVFSYDEINGVNVVNRIAPATAEVQPNSVATTVTAPPAGY